MSARADREEQGGGKRERAEEEELAVGGKRGEERAEHARARRDKEHEPGAGRGPEAPAPR